MRDRCFTRPEGREHPSTRVWLSRIAGGLIGALALAAQAGQTSASITLKVNLIPSTPVSVVTGPSTVVVCGTAPSTGDTGCGVITVPPVPGAGGNVPPISPGGNAGSGSAVPVVPTVPPVVVVPPTTSTPPDSRPSEPASNPLPIARATLELVTLLQTQPEQVSPTALRDLFLLKDPTVARLEQWRSRSIQVFSSGAVERLRNILGTSAEIRIVREDALDYTEMLVGW